MAGDELAGVRVLVTRPAGQGEGLQQLISALGGQAVNLPLLAISPQAPVQTSELTRAQVVIFVSANAVQHARGLLPQLPGKALIGAIGQTTAGALQAAGVRVDLVPPRFDSESLLSLPQLQRLQNQHVVIVRGAGGRATLAAVLRERGADVTYMEVYRRDCPNWTAGEMQQALHADIITVTSAEALDNLAALAKLHHSPALFEKPLAVFHERIASHAAQLGFTLKPFVATQASDEALVGAVRRWRQQTRSNTTRE